MFFFIIATVKLAFCRINVNCFVLDNALLVSQAFLAFFENICIVVFNLYYLVYKFFYVLFLYMNLLVVVINFRVQIPE